MTLGQFHLTGKVRQVTKDGVDAGIDQDITVLAGWTGTFTSNYPKGVPLPDSSDIDYIDIRTVTLLSDGSISEDGVTAGISLTAHDPAVFATPLQWTIKPGTVTLTSGKTLRPKAWTFNAPLAGVDSTLGGLTPVVGIPLQPAPGATPWGSVTGMPAPLAAGPNVANGYAGLDGTGKLSTAQLPISAMEYKGNWNASTNSPTLADGTGSAGDVYKVATGGSRNLGSGSITFAVGDFVIYNGTTWEKEVSAGVDNADGTIGVGSIKGMAPLPVAAAVITANTAPAIGKTTYYNASGGNLAPPMPALSGLSVGARLAVRRDPTDTSTFTITLTCAAGDAFYLSGGTTATLPILGEQREYQVVQPGGSGSKYWAPAGPLNPVSGLGKLFFPLNDGPFSGAATHLRHDRCALLQGYGDSTMSGPGRAFDLMGIDIATFYDANMWYMPFDDTNKTYFNPTPYRTSSRGVRGVGGTGGKIAGTYQGTLPVGDITVEMYLTMPSWTPASSSELLTKWDEAIAGAGHSDQKGIHFGIGTTGLLYFGWTTDGATTTTAVSTAAVPFTAGNPGWIKAVFQANDGSGNNTVKFYTSSSGFSYTQLGSTVTTAGTVTSVYQSSTPYQLLSRNKEFATNHAPTGTYVHFLRVRDAAGNDYVPVLPDKWDPNTTATLEPVYNTGAPILLVASGAISGWSLTNLTDPVRYSQLNSLKGSDLIFIEDGHNEGALTQRQFVEKFVSYVRRLKRTKPLVPIVVTTQNPYDKAGTAWTSDPAAADLNPTKMATMARAMAGESGVWVLDTFPAFTDPTAGTQLNADGRHPSAIGYQLKADYQRRFLLPKAFI